MTEKPFVPRGLLKLDSSVPPFVDGQSGQRVQFDMQVDGFTLRYHDAIIEDYGAEIVNVLVTPQTVVTWKPLP